MNNFEIFTSAEWQHIGGRRPSAKLRSYRLRPGTAYAGNTNGAGARKAAPCRVAVKVRG